MGCIALTASLFSLCSLIIAVFLAIRDIRRSRRICVRKASTFFCLLKEE